MPTLRENSGAIATCNYEARALKIKSGMPLFLAKKLATPQTVFINADKQYYSEVSQKVFEIVDFFCEKVEQVSIDEAYFDLTNPLGFEKAEDVCVKIKQRIRAELGLTCSVGLGPNKLIAKMACGVKKPDGLFVVKPEQVESFLYKQKVSALYGVGPKTEEVFSRNGIVSILDLRKVSKEGLVNWFGEAVGSRLFDFVRGIDSREVEPNRERQQLSKMMTLKQDSSDFDFIKQSIDFLSEMLYKEIVALKKKFKTVSLIIVTERMETFTKSRTSSEPITGLEDLKQMEYDLLKVYLNESFSKVRRVGVRVSNFDENSGFQRKLFEYK
jgi:DNA polymerase IV (DinB-like DNA polymerase)